MRYRTFKVRRLVTHSPILLALVCTMPCHVPRTAMAAESAEAGQSVPVGARFVLETHDGRTVTDENFRGKHLVVFFGYTNCPDICPTSLQTLAMAMDSLGPLAQKVQPLFVTLDPERDSRDVLASYVASFDRRFIGLSGSREMVERMARSYRVKHQRIEGSTPDQYSIDHTAALFHIGPDGAYLGRFPASMNSDQIAEELRKTIATN